MGSLPIARTPDSVLGTCECPAHSASPRAVLQKERFEAAHSGGQMHLQPSRFSRLTVRVPLGARLEGGSVDKKNSLALLPMATRATFRHAARTWQALKRYTGTLHSLV